MQWGEVGRETDRPFYIPSSGYTFDFQKSLVSPGNVTVIDVSQPKYGTLQLRQDGKWSDGEAVTADNFKYSWLRALNKETAAEYAYQYSTLKMQKSFIMEKQQQKKLELT